jgi:hypothetical protein
MLEFICLCIKSILLIKAVRGRLPFPVLPFRFPQSILIPSSSVSPTQPIPIPTCPASAHNTFSFPAHSSHHTHTLPAATKKIAARRIRTLATLLIVYSLKPTHYTCLLTYINVFFFTFFRSRVQPPVLLSSRRIPYLDGLLSGSHATREAKETTRTSSTISMFCQLEVSWMEINAEVRARTDEGDGISVIQSVKRRDNNEVELRQGVDCRCPLRRGGDCRRPRHRGGAAPRHLCR